MKKGREDTEAPEAVNIEQQEAGQAQDVAQDALDRHNQGGHSVTTDQKNADKKTD